MKTQAALFIAAEQHGLEGIISKRAASAYRSGPSRDWVKIKTPAWREANRERWRLFEEMSGLGQARKSKTQSGNVRFAPQSSPTELSFATSEKCQKRPS
jgi:hypothetical protein